MKSEKDQEHDNIITSVNNNPRDVRTCIHTSNRVRHKITVKAAGLFFDLFC